MPPAALGIRAHSGWAAIVTVSGSLHAPVVVDRRRVEIADRTMPGALQPYHEARERPLKQAERVIARCTDRSRRLAREAVGTLLDDLARDGHTPIACGLLLASGQPLPDLETTLASHALVHTAEGELFRNVLAEAGEHHGLAITRVRERDLFAKAATDLRLPVDDLRHRLTEIGRTVGPPWAEDQRNAALIAWLALARA
jgi:hypothetical protein